METIQLTDANVRYHKLGKGPVLILIPGANGTGDIFMPLAKQIADHFTVIAIDRRGFGQSELTAPLPEEAADPHSQYRVKKMRKILLKLRNEKVMNRFTCSVLAQVRS